MYSKPEQLEKRVTELENERLTALYRLTSWVLSNF